MERNNRNEGDILSTMTVAILFLVIILLVVFSASSYKQSTDNQQKNDNSRAVLAYVVTAVKDNPDAEIVPKDFSGNSGLSISDKTGTYEHRIYMKDGNLYEEYGEKGDVIAPEDAIVIGKVSSFNTEYLDKDILRIRTDKGTSYVRTARQTENK